MKSVEMKRAGTVDVYCNIHPDMIAKVKILDNGFYTITDATGAFDIEGVPAGEYPIVAWLPTRRRGARQGHGEGGRGRQGRARDVGERRKKETSTRKDGTPYGRYK